MALNRFIPPSGLCDGIVIGGKSKIGENLDKERGFILVSERCEVFYIDLLCPSADAYVIDTQSVEGLEMIVFVNWKKNAKDIATNGRLQGWTEQEIIFISCWCNRAYEEGCWHALAAMVQCYIW